MNKSLPIITVVALVLAGCSSEPIKTSTTTHPAPMTPSYAHWGFASALRHLHLPTAYNGIPNGLGQQENVLPKIARYLKQGVASWYGPGFHGKKTATGEIFDMYAMTAAHRTLPIPSYAEVTNLENHRSVIVRINDRGPYHGKRVLDLSFAAAKTLDMDMDGVGKVQVKAIPTHQALSQLEQIAAQQAQEIYLQVGSFRSEKKALKLQDEIALHHLPEPEIRPSTYKRATLYKVQIGPMGSIASADKLNQQLAAIGITDTQFVTESKTNTTHHGTIRLSFTESKP